MRSTLYPNTVRPVAAAEVLRAAYERINTEEQDGEEPSERLAAVQAARAALTGADGLGGGVLRHSEQTGARPPYGVVMQHHPNGGSLAARGGVRAITIMVRFECSKDLRDWDAWHTVMHAHLFTLLQGFRPTGLATARCRSAFEERFAADTPRLDDADGTRYSRAGFSAHFVPRRR